MFLFEWGRALRDSDATTSEKVVGFVLATYMSADGGDCFPSVATIAKGAGCSKRTVFTALAGLERRGLLRKVRGGPGRGANRYWALLPSGGSAAVALPVVQHVHQGSAAVAPDHPKTTPLDQPTSKGLTEARS